MLLLRATMLAKLPVWLRSNSTEFGMVDISHLKPLEEPVAPSGRTSGE